MTPKSLFNIILKVLGIYLVSNILIGVPQILSLFLYLADPEMVSEGLWTLFVSIATILAYGAVAYYLIFRTEWVIEKLKLEEGFDQETIPLNIHRSTVLSISIIVLGGLMVVDELPNLCRQLFAYYQERQVTRGLSEPNGEYILMAAGRLIIGLLLLGNQRQVVNFIESRRRK